MGEFDDNSSGDERALTRQHSESDTFNTISPSYEDRLIIVAYGVQAHPEDMRRRVVEQNADPARYLLDDYLRSKLGDTVHFDSDGTITYTSEVQRVCFTIQFVTTKTDFVRALETPRAHVIYNGHARYGRGPCFGDNEGPGPQWGAGEADTGIWRTGYPYIAIPIADMLQHQYFADPVLGSDPKPARSDCDPDIRAHYSSLAPIALRDLTNDDGEMSALTACLSVTGDPAETYWAFQGAEDGRRQPFIVVQAGWQDSDANHACLGLTDLQCKVFCHFGCRTFNSNYPVVRQLRGWTRTADDRFAYWTSSFSNSLVHSRWVHRVLTYNQENAGQSWFRSLEDAKTRTNQDLRNLHQPYQVV